MFGSSPGSGPHALIDSEVLRRYKGQTMSLFRSIPAAAAAVTRMRLRYLLILDFEATCDDLQSTPPRNEMEIIELPTILYDIEKDQVKAIFHEYVRPVRHPTLTKFCTDLTGIEQVRLYTYHLLPAVTLILHFRKPLMLQIRSLPCGNAIKCFSGSMGSRKNQGRWRT